MKNVDKGALIIGLIGTLTLVGLPVIAGFLIYSVVKKEKRFATGLAIGMSIAIIILGTTCFVIMSQL